MPKIRRSFRFSDETMGQLDKCVEIKKKEQHWWDRTKVLEFFIEKFSKGKLKEKK